jgi:hypothetical protein
MRVALGVVLAVLCACAIESTTGGEPSRQRSAGPQDQDGLAILHAFATGEMDGPTAERLRRLDASPLAPVLCLLDVLPPGVPSCLGPMALSPSPLSA